MLFCADCEARLDLNLHADTGECPACGGPLIEKEEERAAVLRGLGHAGILDLVNDGLAAANLARKKRAKGTQ